MQVEISVTKTHENDHCSEYEDQYFLSEKKNSKEMQRVTDSMVHRHPFNVCELFSC
jgi:hypothetical protein